MWGNEELVCVDGFGPGFDGLEVEELFDVRRRYRREKALELEG
jgi:hypothetical protein